MNVRIKFPFLLLVWTTLCVAQGSSDGASPLSHRVWMREHGLPQNSVNAIVQSRDGYIWIGTQEGVARFDGVRFTIFNRRTFPALRSNYTWGLFEDRTGNLWIATSGGGLVCRTKDSAITYTTGDGLPSNIVWTVREDASGAVWAATEDGLARREAPESHFQPIESTRGHSIRSVWFESPHRALVGTNEGLFVLENGRWTPVRGSESLGIHSIRSLPGEPYELTLATSEGLYAWDGTQIRRIVAPARIQRSVIFDIQLDKNGVLWVATGGAGIWYREQGKWSAFTSSSGLGDDQVRSLLIDHEGTVWAGTYGGGLNALHRARFSAITRRNGLRNEFILSLAGDARGRMWFGTYGGGIALWDGSAVRTFGADQTGGAAIIPSIMPGVRGEVYVGGTDHPLTVRTPDGRVRTISTDKSLRSVLAMFIDRRGRLWIGSEEGVAMVDAGRVTSFGHRPDSVGGVVVAIAETRDSSMWFGTLADGLYHLHDGVMTRFTSADGLPSDRIIALHADDDGSLWIGTDGGGLVHLSGGRFTAFTTARGLYDDVVFSVLEDADRNIWMSSNNGIARVSKVDLLAAERDTAQTIACQVFGVADGMPSSECNGRRQPSAWKDIDGRLWFATLKGAAVVDPRTLRLNPIPPPMTIERLLADEKPYPATDGIELPAGTARIALEYTALSFIAPERNQFRYQLEGYDDTWIEAGNRRTAYYTNLRPGEYRFRVIARNNDGVWAETGASLSFILLPRFTQTLLFYFMCAAIGIALVLGFTRLRIQRSRRHEVELVDLIAERTKSLVEEKQRVEAALQETERARKEAERQARIAHEAMELKSRLLHLAAHDLKSPLISINGFTQIIRHETLKNPGLSEIDEMARMINTLSVNMLGLINQMLNTEAIASGEVQLIKRQVDLSRLATDVIEINTMFAENKAQSLRFTPEAEGTCIVEGDEARLRDSIDNLVTNAIKYSPPGKPILIAVRRQNDQVTVSVTDEGPGLTPEDRSKLFRKFQRLSPQPTAGESSTGLGLSVTKEIIEMHDGTIRVESEPGKGSTFTIELPFRGTKESEEG